jgi:hypothetical protein
MNKTGKDYDRDERVGRYDGDNERDYLGWRSRETDQSTNSPYEELILMHNPEALLRGPRKESPGGNR